MITCKEGQHHLVRMRRGFLGSTEMLKIMTQQRWLPDSWLLRMLPSESTQDSIVTKSETKLGTEHLNIASLPAITFSRNMSTSKCWLVTEKLQKNCKKKGSIQLFLEAMHNSTRCTVMHGIVCERNEDALGWSVPRELGDVPRSMPSESTQLRTLTKSDTKLGMEHLKMASLPSITVSWNVWHSYACWETEN